MESGVINNKILNGELRDIFESRQCISDQSGSGNNWAQGHFEYGAKYKEEIEERIRMATEKCDSLQGFFFLHSLGGGTGSGLGTYILKDLVDIYPTVFRFSTCVFPSNDDDVITSPYNSMLALNTLIEHADCVLPVDNQALFDLVSKVDQQYAKMKLEKSDLIKDGSTVLETANAKKKANHFEKENSIVANVINNLTCSMRFEGDLNVDLNEITMNLVPFPKMHFLQSSIAPLYSLLNPKMIPRTID
jgi:tubulin epsilon